MAILETARTLNALISDGTLPRPSRTLRFLWPAEMSSPPVRHRGPDAVRDAELICDEEIARSHLMYHLFQICMIL